MSTPNLSLLKSALNMSRFNNFVTPAIDISLNQSKVYLLSDNESQIDVSDKQADAVQQQFGTLIGDLRRRLKYFYTHISSNYQKVGLHTIIPTYTFDVTGDMRATEAITTNSDYYVNSYLLVPVGTIMQFAGGSVPDGWLFCDGANYSAEDYSRLYAVIGVTYGGDIDGDCDNGPNFNVPDFRGRIPVGLNSCDSDFNALNKTGGEKTHTLTADELPSHNHTINDPGHNHSYVNQPNTHDVAVSLTQTDTADNVNIGQTTGSSTTGITINSTGGGGAHNNLQPYIVVNYIIRF